MSVELQFAISCDFPYGCDNVTDNEKYVALSVTKAKQAGWLLRTKKSGGDLCPAHRGCK